MINRNNATIKDISKSKEGTEGTEAKALSIADLQEQQDFVKYLDMIYQFSRQYTVIISSNDTPIGSYFTYEQAMKLKKMGLRVNLENKFRHSYAAIIDTGEIIFEKLSEDLKEPVEYNYIINHSCIKVCSTGFYVPKQYRTHILVNDINYSPGRRGLDFVVYDKVSHMVLDAVGFDTYAASITCYRPSSILKEVLDYKARHPEISILCLSLSKFPQENLSANEKLIVEKGISRGMIMQQPDNPDYIVNTYIDTSEGVIEVLNAPPSYFNSKGVRRFEDKIGRYVNIIGGHRITTRQPEKFKRTIYIVGGCKIFGVGSSDSGTIASQLQRLLNEKAADQKILVENYGFFLAELEGSQVNEEMKILNDLPVKSEDIVIIDFAFPENWSCIDVGTQRSASYGELFFDVQHHLTEKGNLLAADRVFEKLEELRFFTDNLILEDLQYQETPITFHNNYDLDNENIGALEKYKQILLDFYNTAFVPLIGAVVVNCNPFTLGHRFLIQEAAMQCDHLIVFVVEEDKSYFTFEDRLALVDAGVSDLENVTVIPSGKFIISSLTFSDYFNKSEIQDRTIDTSLDLELFAREIAPCLNIKIRFAGSETHDNISNQYNNTMYHILPKYGIDFIEIPRKKIEGEPISASRVRQLLDEKNFEKIAKIVPTSTLNYLVDKFKNP